MDGMDGKITTGVAPGAPFKVCKPFWDMFARHPPAQQRVVYEASLRNGSFFVAEGHIMDAVIFRYLRADELAEKLVNVGR